MTHPVNVIFKPPFTFLLRIEFISNYYNLSVIIRKQIKRILNDFTYNLFDRMAYNKSILSTSRPHPPWRVFLPIHFAFIGHI